MADLDTNTNTDTASAVAPNGAPVISDIAADEDAYRRQQQELSRSVAEALNGDDGEAVRTLVLDLHPSDLADLFECFGFERRQQLISIIKTDFDPLVLSELDEAVRDQVIEHLGVEDLAAKLSELDTDDAVGILVELEEAEQREVLDAIAAADRALIEEGLGYPEDSAGRLMQRQLVAIPNTWTVGETIDYLRNTADNDADALPEDFYDLFVVDPAHRPVGSVPLSRAMRTKRPVPMCEIMESNLILIPAITDQEEVAFMFRQRDLVSAPVTDADGRLVGVVTADDVFDIIAEESEEDILALGGVQSDDLYSSVFETTRSRFTWLLVNLGTAVLASLVISLFDATIEQMVALAVLMPIVASMGGNAGTQTLTVAVRALATRELTWTNAHRVVGKELVVGAVNGMLFALLTGTITWYWFDSSAIGAVIAAAMVINLVTAALVGAVTPLALERVGIDPAVASSVFLTTATDIVGFFAFLGLAAAFLL